MMAIDLVLIKKLFPAFIVCSVIGLTLVATVFKELDLHKWERPHFSFLQRYALGSRRPARIDNDDIFNYALQPPVKFSPFPNAYNSPIMDNGTKLLFCWIPKNACTRFKALFCRRHVQRGKNGTKEALQKIQEYKGGFVHMGKLCSRKNGIYGKMKAQRKMDIINDSSWKKWAVIRDPFDRIISGWVSKCSPSASKSSRKRRCYGCDSDFRCFVEENFNFMRNFSFDHLFTKRKGYINNDHFYPQYWHCDFKHFSGRYRLFHYSKSQSFGDTIRTAFLEAGWPSSQIHSGWGHDGTEPFLEEKRPKIINDSQSNRTEYRDAATAELIADIDLTDAVFKAYFIDYMAFKFNVPSWTEGLCRTATNSSQYFVCRYIATQV